MGKRKVRKNYIEYNGRRFHERAARDAYRVALDMMREASPGAVLDLAAGSGYMSARLADLGFEVTAYDINTDQFVPAEITIKKADLNNPLPEPEQSATGVLALEVLEHLENPRGFLREMGRLIKPGGCLVLSTPNIVSLPSKIRFLFREEMALFYNVENRIRDPFSDEASGHISPLLPWLLLFFLKDAGFRVETTTYTKKYGIVSKHLGRTLLLKAIRVAAEKE
jgi:SAM-dependent methyltransferase